MDWSLMFNAQVMVFGCGNVLKGDDGVGPAVIHRLEIEGNLPSNVGLLDVGTSIKSLLFDLVTMNLKLQRMIIVDAITKEYRQPGEFWEIDVDDIEPKKLRDFSIHIFPSGNLLKRIKEQMAIELKILTVQTGFIPSGLEEKFSPEVEAAIPAICRQVRKFCQL